MTDNNEIYKLYQESKGIYVSTSNKEQVELEEKVFKAKQNKGFKYLYQNGPMYLHPLNFEMLIKDYDGVMNLPLSIKAPVLEIEEYLTGSYIRAGISFAHLPLGTKVLLVELDLKDHLTIETYRLYETKLKE